MSEGDFHKFAHGMRFVRRHDEIIAFVMLQDAPHALDVFRRVTPVAFCLEIPEE